MTFLGRAVVMLLAACAVAGATAQDCTVADFRIVKANVLALRCSELRPHVTERRVTVIELDAAGIASGASISGDAKLDEVARRWLDLALASDLKTGKKYLVLDPGDNPAFAPVPISTEAAATISLVDIRNGRLLDGTTIQLGSHRSDSFFTRTGFTLVNFFHFGMRFLFVLSSKLQHMTASRTRARREAGILNPGSSPH